MVVTVVRYGAATVAKTESITAPALLQKAQIEDAAPNFTCPSYDQIREQSVDPYRFEMEDVSVRAWLVAQTKRQHTG